MRPSYDNYLAIVEFLVHEQKKSVSEAITAANVPKEFIPYIESQFSETLSIKAPKILFDSDTGIKLIAPDLSKNPEFYSSALRNFLGDINGRNRDPEIVENIASSANSLCSQLPAPLSNGPFAHRGLVVGHIQSGKTASMAALIAKAADYEYKLFIVLAGLWNDLRSQTQRRLDQEITGITDFISDGPLVTHPPLSKPWVRLTTSGVEGEFSGVLPDVSEDKPKLAVIKKNVKVLERFINFLQSLPIDLAKLPALIIDDEADQASINTKYGRSNSEGEREKSRTNELIVNLLSMLPKHTYVGYTASPFANVLIDSTEEENLYPRNFIATLPEPNGYLGPRQLFGLGMRPSELSPDVPEPPALDVIRSIPVEESRNMGTMASDQDCPPVLEEAILSFILSCCARIERGQSDQHFSMFIHPSYATDRQQIFNSIIEDHLKYLKAGIPRPDSFSEIVEAARKLWNEDHRRVTMGYFNSENRAYTFEDIWKHANSVISSIDIRLLNYQSEDTLDYRTSQPKRYIIIGGNRLSRGLTIEGLMVSVFLRDTLNYDTLLQMGRWFGFRPNYEDLTRIYVDDDVSDRFADLARIELELREDLEKYAEEPNPPTPLEAAPRIRSHPIMLVTARNKMGRGRPDVMSLAGRPRETVSFPVENIEWIRYNLHQTKEFLKDLGSPIKNDSGNFWRGIESSKITDFVSKYIFSERAEVVNRKIIGNYIKGLNEKGELVEWDVFLPKGNPSCEIINWTNEVVSHKIQRSPRTKYSIGVLRSPSDIEKWRSTLSRQKDDPKVGCLTIYTIDKASKSSSGSMIYSDPNNAEDIVALLFVFPKTRNAVPITYITQQEDS